MSKIVSINNINKTIRYFKKNGLKAAYYAAKERVENRGKQPYVYAVPTATELDMQKQDSDCSMRISVVVPTYNTPESFLRELIEAVVEQSYANWELILADASDKGDVEAVTGEYAKKDNRIKYLRLDDNLGISDNTNAGISVATGEYIALLDHDDILTPDALYHMVKKIEACDIMPAICYSDEDKTDTDSKTYYDPNIKYDFNYDLLLTNNYICHLMFIKRDKLSRIKLRKEYDGAQDFDLVLQIVEDLINFDKVGIAELGDRIVHVPKVLYHWRCHAESTASNTASKMYAYEAGLRAVKNHIKNVWGEEIEVIHSKHLGFYRVLWKNNISDYFGLRPEVGVLIGRVLNKNGKMCPCIMNECGDWLYEGINRHYAGELNRFDCMQDVYAADIRYAKINPAAMPLINEVLAYFGADIDNINDKDAKRIFAECGKRLRDRGYLIVYDPSVDDIEVN